MVPEINTSTIAKKYHPNTTSHVLLTLNKTSSLSLSLSRFVKPEICGFLFSFLFCFCSCLDNQICGKTFSFTMLSSGRSKVPFTASQWQELEHQALIFKYMVSGMPIPPDLLYTIRRSLDSSLSSKLLLHQPQHIGWSCFQMGYGRKIDPDPGRCRRTDGKKWRCSKEVYPDSKYCERHMHRGRNRSRKPVEVMTPTPSIAASTRPTPTSIPISLNNEHSAGLSSFSSINDSISSVPFAYPHSSSSRPSGLCFSSQDNNNFLLESSPYCHAGKEYRNSYGHGMKEVGEHTFLSEAFGTMRSMPSSSMGDSWQLSMGASLGHLNQKDSSGLQSGESYLQLFSLGDNSSRQQRQQYQHHNYAPEARSDDQPPKKVMHHFFDEWPPPKDKDSWPDSEDKLSISIDQSLSKTQLSISMPNPFT